MNIFSLENKIALVTGGGSGIGFDIARCLKEAGAVVVLTGRREEVLQQAVERLGKGAHYLVNDVTDLATLPGLIQQVEATLGAIDILVNNAGVNMKKPALEVTDDDFHRIVQTNLHAVFALTRECARRMIARQRGSIIMITSMAAYYGIDRVAAYAASKSAVAGMIKVLASEFSPYNVRINAIAPGFIETDMMKTAMSGDPDRMNRALRRTPMSRFGKPADIGYAAVFLASDASGYITGASLPVDGGNSIGF
ncbi:SDR family NAD(P)-dependent oxidoreductase [Siphonobacter aquaeclarae]|uniref:NAD(P)-dependent dehydrogenase, short-chain alcohol dehydrogenase family n=1 Tax=Siphonobacter aquaeclarae TaxID=563176 RepID=A0A1G9MCQ8_9BACT|nr:glucose 1-dehydrogenase [Siphonobacter aquaeclarae]MBO9637094.1 glucose 1-dehydrogenase [Siphonobacter aquaeclarae]SDL72046.1 NAD(P)-dependent dehydrogenase, short-chain alcohol dehydrogenase family [Siphonobacter aquaeclarae]